MLMTLWGKLSSCGLMVVCMKTNGFLEISMGGTPMEIRRPLQSVERVGLPRKSK